MITYYSNKQYDETTQMVEIACLSTDSKPTAGIANGSLCLEMDTGDIYAFNEAGTAWVKLS